jgi:hypothetical protein
MADPVFTESSEAPVVTTSSLDNDPELRANWDQVWDDIDAEAEAKAGLPEAPQSAREPISDKDIEAAAGEEKTPVEVKRHDAKPKKKLSESKSAPTTSDISEILDGPTAAKPVSPEPKPIFNSQRRFLLGRCSPGAASRAMRCLGLSKCSAISLPKFFSKLL